MPKQHSVKAPQGSLVTSVNTLTVAEGSLLEATNLEFTEQGALKPRRGFDFVTGWEPGDTKVGLNNIRQGMDYNGTFLTIDSDGDVVWNNGTGALGLTSETISDDSDNGYGFYRYAYANRNLYYTTDAGVKKIDAISGSPLFAGMKNVRPPHLLQFYPASGLTLPTAAVQPGNTFLPNGSSVRYKAVLGYRDENDNVLLSVPSGYAGYTNGTGSAKGVALYIGFGAGLSTDFFVQLYRTESSTTTPSENYYLVAEQQLTSTDVTNKYVGMNDFVPDTLLEVPLYTSAAAEGDTSANFPPPVSTDLASFRGYMFYANKQNSSKIDFRIGAIAAAAGDAGLRAVRIGGGTTADWTSGSPTISSIPSTTGVEVGMSLCLPVSGFAQGVTVVSKTATSLTLSANATASVTNYTGFLNFGDYIRINNGVYDQKFFPVLPASFLGGNDHTFQLFTSGTASANINSTTQSFVQSVNENFAADGVDVYALALTDFTPGTIGIIDYGVAYGDAPFAISTDRDSALIPAALAASPYTAEAETQPHLLYFSKFEQPEAVPLLNNYPIGARNYPILRLASLQNSLIIFKTDGVYQLTGFDENSFSVRVLDPSLQLTHVNSVAVVHNRAYALTDRGVVSVGENDIRVESAPIQNELYDQTSGFVPPSNQLLINAIAIPDTNNYILQLNDADKTAWCLDVVTGQWGKWKLSSKSYLYRSWSDTAGNLYVCDYNSKYVSTRQTTNTYDELYTVAAASYSASAAAQTVTIPKSELEFRPAVGDRFQFSNSNFVSFVASSASSGSDWVVTLADTWTAAEIDESGGYEIDVKTAIQTLIAWPPSQGDSLVGSKHWDTATMLYKSNSVTKHLLYWSNELDGKTQFTDYVSSYSDTTIPDLYTVVERTPAGEDAFDSYTAGIPRGARFSNRLRMCFHHRRAGEEYTLEGVDLSYRGQINKGNRRDI